MKKTLIATIVVFLAWAVMDFIIHGLLLQSLYASSPSLFRPQAEMKMALMYVVVFIAALCFVSIYQRCCSPKGMGAGIQYGLLYGIAVGVGMGYGSYAVIPIPYFMALGWFLGTVAESLVAGAIVGGMVKE
jgi:hypothetical protein